MLNLWLATKGEKSILADKKGTSKQNIKRGERRDILYGIFRQRQSHHDGFAVPG